MLSKFDKYNILQAVLLVMALFCLQKNYFLGLAGALLLLALNILFFRAPLNEAEALVKKAEQIFLEISKVGFNANISFGSSKQAKRLGEGFNKILQKLKETASRFRESQDILEIKVKARTQELQDLTDNLEKEVQKRTRDLQNKVDELKRFQDLAVGRELKMIELKDRISLIEGRRDKLKTKKR